MRGTARKRERRIHKGVGKIGKKERKKKIDRKKKIGRQRGAGIKRKKERNRETEMEN